MLNYDAYSRIGASQQVLDRIKFGVKIPFSSIPGHYRYPNKIKNSEQDQFVSETISSLLKNGSIRKCDVNEKPRCINAIKTAPKRTKNFDLFWTVARVTSI